MKYYHICDDYTLDTAIEPDVSNVRWISRVLMCIDLEVQVGIDRTTREAILIRTESTVNLEGLEL